MKKFILALTILIMFSSCKKDCKERQSRELKQLLMIYQQQVSNANLTAQHRRNNQAVSGKTKEGIGRM